MSGIGQGSACEFDDFGSGSVAREFWGFVQRIRESGLPAHVRHTALEIWLHMRPGKMWSHPSVARLARHTGLSERTIQSDIKKLNEAGLFEVEFSKGGRTQSHNFIAKRIAETAQELRGMLDENPEGAAGYSAETPQEMHRFSETPHAVHRFDGDKPRTACTVSGETAQLAPENPAGAAPEATSTTLEGESLKGSNITPPYSPPPPAEHRSVWIEDGVPVVVNGRRAALEKLLGGKGLDLDTALVAVAAQVPDGEAEDIWANLTTAIAAYAATGGKKPRQKRTKVPEVYTEDFGHFWALYPRPVGKGAAFAAWQKLTMPQKRKAYSALRQHLPELEAKKRSPKGNICPHPSTWLNQGRFDDPVEVCSPQPSRSFEDRRRETANEWLLRRPMPEKPLEFVEECDL